MSGFLIQINLIYFKKYEIQNTALQTVNYRGCDTSNAYCNSQAGTATNVNTGALSVTVSCCTTVIIACQIAYSFDFWSMYYNINFGQNTY